MSYLKTFPIDVLKIDRSFITDCICEKSDGVIVESIVNIAKSLNLKVVAEGIETQHHYDVLATIGCDFGQGYLVSKPLPQEQFVDFVNTYNVKETSLPRLTG